MIERVLNMKFKSATGGSFTFAIKDAKEEILDEDISTAMDTIIESDVFSAKGASLESKDSAEIVTKEVTEIEL